VGSTKLVAMLATKKSKPNGQHCVDLDSMRSFFEATQLQQIKGAGLAGIIPEVRSVLLARLGSEATVSSLCAVLDTDLEQWVGSEQASVVKQLLERCCDGSAVGRYSLPKTISVELCVRPSHFEACTEQMAIRHSFTTLGQMLHSRIAEDAVVFGIRSARMFIAKWKTMGNRAKKVQQRSIPLHRAEATAITADEFAAQGFQLFCDSHPRGAAFAVSRLVVVLQYEDQFIRRHLPMQRIRKRKRVEGTMCQPTIAAMFKRGAC